MNESEAIELYPRERTDEDLGNMITLISSSGHNLTCIEERELHQYRAELQRRKELKRCKNLGRK